MARDIPDPLRLTAAEVYFSLREVRRGGRRIRLTPTEHRLLSYFVTHANRLITQGELLEQVWQMSSHTRTSTVYVTINRLRKKIEATPRRPAHIFNSSGAGYIFRLVSAATPTRTVPVPNTNFFGRVDERDQLVARCASPGVVTVLGAAGMGKTRLALALLEAQPQRGWFVNLTEARDAAAVTRAVAATIGCPLTSADPAETLINALENLGGALLVLDNFEQALTAADETVGRWLRSVEGLRCVVTSRVRLGLAEERVFELGPLDDAAAAALFLDRAQQVRSSFNAEPMALSQLIGALGGSPLALELAANRARIMDVEQLLSALDDQLDVLARGGPALAPRHRSLRAAIQGSWSLLDPSAQQVLAQLSVFAAPFTAAAAQHVCTSSSANWVPDVLQTLLDHSLLVEVASPDGPPRMTMWSAIRAFAAEQLQDADATRQRYGMWFARFGAPSSLLALRRSRRLRASRSAEIDDLWGAARALEGHGLLTHAGSVLEVLEALYTSAGPVAPLCEHLEGFLERYPALPALNRRRLVFALSRLYTILGRHPDGIRLLSAEEAREDTDASYGVLLLRRAEHHMWSFALEEATPLYQRALAWFDGTDDLQGQGMVYQGLGRLAMQRSDNDAAEAVFSISVDRFRAAGDQDRAADALTNLANVLHARGAAAAARGHYQTALQQYSTNGDEAARSRALNGLAVCMAASGDDDGALQRYSEALAINRRLGDARAQAIALFNRGSLQVVMGRVDGGRADLERALALCQRVRARRVEAMTLSGLGALELPDGDLVQARRRLIAAREIAQEWEWFGLVLTTSSALAMVSLGEGDLDAAAQQLDALHAVEARANLPFVSATVDCRRARLARAQGDLDATRRWLRHARALATRAGMERSQKFTALMADFADIDPDATSSQENRSN
ncbi:MAG: tetratricopeptide repeat protein [Myxococcota bacterium]